MDLRKYFSRKKPAMVDSLLLVAYIAEAGGAMSHLKLQKLLYYIQAFHLASFDAPIVEDKFEAWVHGPVSRKVYNSLKDKSVLYDELEYIPSANAPKPSEKLPELLTIDQLEVVDAVINEFGKMTSSQLENLTHSEQPWIEARKGYDPGDRCDVVISQDTMSAFYRNQMYG